MAKNSRVTAAVLGSLVDAGRELGHDVTVRERSYGRVKHHWVDCSCGYESSPGRSQVFAVAAGAGHLDRVRKRAGEMAPPDPSRRGVSLPGSVGGRQ
jgi:hypothetical protein